MRRAARVETSGTCCGRPFLDGDRLLGPKVTQRTDWLATSVEAEEEIAVATRAALARAWLRDARIEHASIASFAQFTLQLLAAGAPPDLVAAAQHAALDEVAHARDAYSLASRYAGHALGPGELPMPKTLAVSSLVDAAVLAVHEGCVAETLAALQAQEQLRNARDTQVKAALARVAEDEARHAALAYQFVRWALFAGDEQVVAAVSGAFVSAREKLLTSIPRAEEQDLDVTAWRAHGRLTAADERTCMLAGLREVIEPCARALLQVAGQPSA